ncbi:uncharacterized protein K02A2.6-like [Dermacentor silvarum]|uniref:uncharacterized protein K02A2.6-like n=1 Tax=Dermacentor silvarum TaxID=543639 RepID=UPI0021012E2A|nr:uncharacterized protein K02A2.6-like [Dermacentor silvarum]
MVVVDDFSKYLVVIILHTLAAPTVIKQLLTMFAQFGCPEIVKSDNGPPFQSEGFAEFASELGFKHHRITPRWPEANGEAERFIRTLKKSILTSRVSHLDWTIELQSFLLTYRTQLTLRRESPVTSHNQLHVGQQVLCKQDRSNKFSSYYDPHPYTITKVTGSIITASIDGVSICRNSSFFKDVSTVQMERHQDQLDMPDLDDAAVPSNSDLPSHSTATPREAPPATTKTASRRYPQRTRQRPERLKAYV